MTARGRAGLRRSVSGRATLDGRAAARVVMLLDNHYGPDRRVEMECALLSRAGARVRIVAWDRRSNSGTDEATTNAGRAEVMRVSVPAPRGGGRDTFVAMLRFGREVWRRRGKLVGDADVLVVHDVYLLGLGWLLSLAMRVPLVYDAHEEYAAMEGRRYPAWWLNLVTFIEDSLARRAAVIVVPGETRCARWELAGFARPVVLRNFGARPQPRNDAKPTWEIAYCGAISDVRRLDVLLEAACRRPQLRVLIAGLGRGAKAIEERAHKLANVEYVGWVDDPDELERRSRTLYYGLDPDHPYASKACPNTLYDALRLRRPLLYFCTGEIAEVDARFRIGVRCEPTADALLAAFDSAVNPAASWQFEEAWSELAASEMTRYYVTAVLGAALPNLPSAASRSRVHKWRRIALIGPRPLRIARTLAFLVRRRARAAVLRCGYDGFVARARPRGRFLLPRVELASREQLPAVLTDAAEALCAEACMVLAHQVDYLGSGPVSLGESIDWHTDFKSGYRWEPAFYQDVEMTRLNDDSDAKVPWELSRGHQLLTLARAARLTGDRRFAAELEAQLSHWLRSNPPGRGINWTTPMEIGFRAVNWIWALGTLEPSIEVSAELREGVARSLYWHACHIAANIEGTPYLRSNHYLGNILGLLAIGTSFPDDRRARRWARRAHDAFEREIMDEVYPDGVGFEGSLSYHGLSLEMFLVARHLADLAGRPFSAAYDTRLRRMLDVVRAARHATGRMPLFGDQDSGRLLPAGFARPATHDPLVWVGSALLGGGRPLCGPPSPEVAWNLGIEAYRRVQDVPEAAPAPPRAFEHGGLYLLDGCDTHVAVRCGDVGQHGGGGHAHNDLFSYELSHHLPFVVDSGTYAYTFDVDARNEMRSTRAHNVTIVDRAELNPLDPRAVFRLAQVAHPTVEEFSVGDTSILLVVSHDGYQRLDPSVGMRRTFEVDRTTGGLQITDDLAGAGERLVETHVHLDTGVMVRPLSTDSFQLRRGEWCLTLAFDCPGLQTQLEDGWVSDRYGARIRASVLVTVGTVALPARLSYSVIPEPAVAETGMSRVAGADPPTRVTRGTDQ